MPIHDWTRVKAGIFHDFHHTWIAEIKRALNSGLLPPPYYALAEQVTGHFGPDVLALEAPSSGQFTEHSDNTSDFPPRGGIALAVRPPPMRFHGKVEADRYAAKANVISIRHTSGHHVVAMLEIVSPGNKSGVAAVRRFTAKAVEIIESGVHLAIIDLFPPGRFDPSGIQTPIWTEVGVEGPFDQPADRPLTLASYVGGIDAEAFVEPTAVGLELIDLPLFVSTDWYVPLPLEATYKTAFAAVPSVWRDVLTGPSSAAS